MTLGIIQIGIIHSDEIMSDILSSDMEKFINILSFNISVARNIDDCIWHGIH